MMMGMRIAAADVFEGNTVIDIDEHGSIMLIINPDNGEIVQANQAAVDFYGYSMDVLLSMRIDEINTLSESEVKEEMEAAKKEKRLYFQFGHKLKSGEIRYVDVYSSPVQYNAERYLFSIIHDITDRKEAEIRALRNRRIIDVLIVVIFISLMVYLNREKERKRLLSDLNSRYDSLFQTMEEGVALHEIILEDNVPVDYVFLDANESFYEQTGLENRSIIGKRVKEIFPEIESYWIDKYGEVATTGKRIRFENYSAEIDKYFSVNVYSPSKNRFVTVFNDITESKKSAEIIEREKAFLQTTLFSLSDGVISTDINGNIEIMNIAAFNLIDMEEDDVIGRNFDTVFTIVNELTKLEVSSPVERILHTGNNTIEEIDVLLISDSTGETPIEMSASPIINSSGEINGVVVVIRDVTEKRERLERISYLSYHDQLTGIYNRHFFEEELIRLDADRNMPISLLMIDVNGLKLTNDAFGHTAGDELLKAVTTLIQNTCREDEIFARIGGDEFVILLPNTDEKGAEKLCKRIEDEVSSKKSGSIVISVSIGFATKNQKDVDIKSILNKAEEHMYSKKINETKSMRNATIKVILDTLNEKSGLEKEHSDKVSELSVAIGKTMNLSVSDLKELRIAGLMHDIGKITVSSSIIEKSGKLTNEEYEEVKKHTETGYHILKSVDKYSNLADYALHHHERWDGAGYPDGLKGDDIPLFARIIAIADAYDAMISYRPYRRSLTKEEAKHEIEKNAGSQFDPNLIQYFLEVIGS